MATVVLDSVSKRFSRSVVAVDDISLEVGDHAFLVLVGPSGCGKSTTLRLIAGLESCDRGEVRIDGRRVNEVAAKDRDLAMVFQNYALYPHMTVYKNLSFGLELRYGGGIVARVLRRIFHPAHANELVRLRRGISQRVLQAARRLSIEHLLGRRPHQLSGGERQRVALGRAIVRNPAAFLFDEPLSNLDAKLRMEMRTEMKRLHHELAATMIYVTHDQTEAMTLGDQITVMNRGRIEQTGTPQAVYRNPANRFVAEFIGTMPMNFVDGTIVGEGPQRRFLDDQRCLVLPLPTSRIPQQSRVTMGVKPEHVSLRRMDRLDGGIVGRVVQNDWLGDSSLIHLELRNQGDGLQRLRARGTSAEQWPPEMTAAIDIDPDDVVWFDPVSGDNLMKESL